MGSHLQRVANESQCWTNLKFAELIQCFMMFINLISKRVFQPAYLMEILQK